MALVGDIVSLLVSLVQEIGIVAGVGAVTMTLIGHLLSLHAHKNETVYGYVRAARYIRALGLAAIIVSGCAAILIHVQTQTLGVLLAPAFIFKWLLIMVLTAFYFVELKATGVWQDAVEGFEGANWYALFIVHTMAPIVGWGLLLAIYFGWLATFAVIWAGFVWSMRRSTPAGFVSAAAKPAPVAPKPMPAPVPPAAPKPAAPAPVPAPQAPVVQKPAPIAQPKVEVPPLRAPSVGQVSKVEVVANHSMLPMIAELDLPAPKKIETPTPPPAPAPMAPVMQAPKPQAPVEVIKDAPKQDVPMTDLDKTDLPALHVMPKRPEDITTSKRGPVVKMNEE